MSEGIHASYTKVGVALMLGAAAIVFSLIYFGGYGAQRDTLTAEMYCSTSAGGLSVGSAVNFRGVKVGEVKRITFLGAVYQDIGFEYLRTVYIEMSFDTTQLVNVRHVDPAEALDRMLKHGLYGRIDESGITGLAKINLDMPEKPLEKLVEPKTYPWRPDHQVIPLMPSMMESLSDTATKIMNEIDQIDIVAAWSNINSVAENATSVAKSADRLLKSMDGIITRIADRVETAVDDADDLVNRIKDNPSLLIRAQDRRPLTETSR